MVPTQAYFCRSRLKLLFTIINELVVYAGIYFTISFYIYFMSIWFKKDISVEDLLHRDTDTLSDYLGMMFTQIGDDFLCVKMPVNNRTRQPYGILHGGASAALAETAGSVASALVIDPSKYRCVGLELNANHIRSVKEGNVTATCKPIHIGRQTHVWDIQITEEATQKLVCISRLTVMVLPV